MKLLKSARIKESHLILFGVIIAYLFFPGVKESINAIFSGSSFISIPPFNITEMQNNAEQINATQGYVPPTYNYTIYPNATYDFEKLEELNLDI